LNFLLRARRKNGRKFKSTTLASGREQIPLPRAACEFLRATVRALASVAVRIVKLPRDVAAARYLPSTFVPDREKIMTAWPAPLRRLAAIAAAALLVAGAASASPTCALAQAPSAGAPPAAPWWAVGRPDNEAARKLAPIDYPQAPFTEDQFQLDKLTLPSGFRIELYAAGVPDARAMARGDRGAVFVGSHRSGTVHAVVERAGQREVKVIATGLQQPGGVAFHKGSLYVAEVSRIWRYDKIEADLDKPPEPVLVTDQLPTDEVHGPKFIAIGPDNKLYVPVGIPCNNCLPSENHGGIWRMDLDGQNRELVAQGVRNTLGFDWHPATRQLHFTDTGRFWVSEDLPADELNRVTKDQQHFGNPFCHQGDFLDPQFGWGRSCEEFVKPLALLGPHTAASGMRFYTGRAFPPRFRGAIFIARHGSWSRTEKLGGDVVVAFLGRDGAVTSVEPFLTGFLQENSFTGRPVDVLVMADGALLVSDAHAGAIYRIVHGPQRPARQRR
jgi:glucose/arabinose dehydrogenase